MPRPGRGDARCPGRQRVREVFVPGKAQTLLRPLAVKLDTLDLFAFQPPQYISSLFSCQRHSPPRSGLDVRHESISLGPIPHHQNGLHRGCMIEPDQKFELALDQLVKNLLDIAANRRGGDSRLNQWFALRPQLGYTVRQDDSDRAVNHEDRPSSETNVRRKAATGASTASGSAAASMRPNT